MIKIGSAGLAQDRRRIEAAAAQLPGGDAHLAVDAIYAYDAGTAPAATAMLAPFGLWWFEGICDPLDFATQATVAATHQGPIAAGEALFSLAEAKLLDRHGGLRRERDVLEFDPVHCYGLPGFVQIVDCLTAKGWPRRAFWPHGGAPCSAFTLLPPSAWAGRRSIRSASSRCAAWPTKRTSSPDAPIYHKPRASASNCAVERTRRFER